MSDQPTIETLEDEIGDAVFAIKGDDAKRVVYLLGLALGIARRYRDERDGWRAENDRHRSLYIAATKDSGDLWVQLNKMEAERGQLRAVVDAARAWRATRAMANLQRIADDPEGAFDEAEAAVDALLRALDQLDVSPTMGGDSDD